MTKTATTSKVKRAKKREKATVPTAKFSPQTIALAKAVVKAAGTPIATKASDTKTKPATKKVARTAAKKAVKSARSRR